MPIYEYLCEKCGHEFEREQRITEDPVKTCPECRARKVKRLISQTSFVLKGSGWYSDLYSSSKDAKQKDGADAGDAKEASGKESKDAGASSDASGGEKAGSGEASKSDAKGKGKGKSKKTKKPAGKKAAA